jgi:alpha-L-fucosidase
MKGIRNTLAMAALLAACSAPLLGYQNFTEVKPSPQQVAWQDLEFGVIIHFSTNTFLDREWGDGTASPAVFNPTNFDPDQWMQAIKASGAKYVVLVAKHHDGFCLWPTEQTDYSVKASPWRDGKGDVVGEVARSARKFGLKFGVYLSPWDRHDPRYANPEAYDKYYLSELEELAQRYGDLVEFWLDGAGSAGHVYNFPRIIETLRTYQPNTIVFADTGLFEYGDARWVGTESGRVDYENWNVIDRHGYLRWRPIEADTPLRELHWFWHPHDEASLKSLDESDHHLRSRRSGAASQLMLGLAPDTRGTSSRLRRSAPERIWRSHSPFARPAISPCNIFRRLPEVAAAVDGNVDTFWSAPAGLSPLGRSRSTSPNQSPWTGLPQWNG